MSETRYRYQNPNRPYHLSVGALVFDDERNICVHRYESHNAPEGILHLFGGLDVVYLLVRETVHDNESLETAVLRGVSEEFGVIGEVDSFLGTLIAEVRDVDGWSFEKTTPYHSVRKIGDGERDVEDEENFSELVWLAAADAREKFAWQAAHTDRQELNELLIIDRFIARYID